eukprot:11178805-Lingulodinium_polyedra.AAC.1
MSIEDGVYRFFHVGPMCSSLRKLVFRGGLRRAPSGRMAKFGDPDQCDRVCNGLASEDMFFNNRPRFRLPTSVLTARTD